MKQYLEVSSSAGCSTVFPLDRSFFHKPGDELEQIKIIPLLIKHIFKPDRELYPLFPPSFLLVSG